MATRGCLRSVLDLQSTEDRELCTNQLCAGPTEGDGSEDGEHAQPSTRYTHAPSVCVMHATLLPTADLSSTGSTNEKQWSQPPREHVSHPEP
jgi:hypothetical protein